MGRRPQGQNIRHTHYTNCTLGKHGRIQVSAEDAQKGCPTCLAERQLAEAQALVDAPRVPIPPTADQVDTPPPAAEPELEAGDDQVELEAGDDQVELEGDDQVELEGDDELVDEDPPPDELAELEAHALTKRAAPAADLVVDLVAVAHKHGVELPTQPSRFMLAAYRFLRTLEGDDDGRY